jgi:hypothetical protein
VGRGVAREEKKPDAFSVLRRIMKRLPCLGFDKQRNKMVTGILAER